jgi:hypothetical protein
MKDKLIASMFLLVLSSESSAAVALSYESYEPAAPVQLLASIPEIPNVDVFRSVESVNGTETFKQFETYLRIDDGAGAWWVHTPEPFSEIGLLAPVDESTILVSLRSASASATATLNLLSRELFQIGLGIAEIVVTGPDEGLIYFKNQYGFDEAGRFWYSVKTDRYGRAVEFFAEGTSCIPLSDLLSPEADTSMLRQPLSFCAGIDR